MITMHEENKKSFLDELQSLNETTKKKVAVVATAVLMIGVVYLWLGYFNGVVADDQAQQQTTAQQNPTGPSFAQNFQKGVAAIGGDFTGIGQAFVGALKSPGEYSVQPQSQSQQ
jgi:hypothetical protein